MKSPSLFKEYIWLVKTIYESGKITLRELNDKWRLTEASGGLDMPRTTFSRHRDAIAEIFGVFIDCDRSTKQYYIMNRKSLEEDSVQNWMLTTLSVNTMLTESVSVADKILLEDMPEDHGFLKTVLNAIKDGTRLRLTYQKYGQTEPSVRIIEPYCLKMYNRKWYMLVKQGRTHADVTDAKSEFRLFALDRVKGIEVLGERYKIDADFSAKEYFSEIFGVVNDERVKAEKIVVRAFKSEVYKMRDLPVHASQREIVTAEGYSDFELLMKPTFEFKGYLLSRGTYVRILEPSWLVEDMAKSVSEMLEMYGRTAES